MRNSDIMGNMTLKPRLMIDTNVLVAALRNKNGPSFALMQLVRRGLAAMYCSPALFLEYEDVLKRPAQLMASGLLSTDVDAVLNELAGLMVPVTTHYQWRPQLRDPADEMVLEAAVNGQVNVIVTYNLRDFLPAQRFGIPVLNPQQTFKNFGFPIARSTTP